jgi:hypothetical protein
LNLLDWQEQFLILIFPPPGVSRRSAALLKNYWEERACHFF